MPGTLLDRCSFGLTFKILQPVKEFSFDTSGGCTLFWQFVSICHLLHGKRKVAAHKLVTWKIY